MDKIIEISLSKIENTNSRVNTGKTSLLHRHLLVNSLLNRVRGNDKTIPDETLMNYREPKSLIEMDIEDCDMKKVPSFSERSPQKQRSATSWKQTSLLLDNNIITESSNEGVLKEKNENITCECKKATIKVKKDNSSYNQKARKRQHSIDLDDQNNIKKFRCTSGINKTQEMGASITSLASLFGGLVANTENDSSKLSLQGNFLSAMVAC